MKLKIIGSSSAGNCYILESADESLIIECGVKMDQILRGINFRTAKVVGCLLSHEHLDHAKSAIDVVKAGIKLYATGGTFEALKIRNTHHRLFEIFQEVEFTVGSFKILPFNLQHDAREPVGFLIHHSECGNVLFITDSYYVEHVFRGLNNIIIEANYCQKIIDKRVGDGASPEFLRNRIFKSHMSLATCKSTLLANDLSKVNNIVLIHLSDGNSDAERFQLEIAQATGKQVYVAEPNLIIDFNKNAF